MNDHEHVDFIGDRLGRVLDGLDLEEFLHFTGNEFRSLPGLVPPKRSDGHDGRANGANKAND